MCVVIADRCIAGVATVGLKAAFSRARTPRPSFTDG